MLILKTTIDRLKSENNARLETIAEVKIKLEKSNQKFVEYEKYIESKNLQIDSLSETREEMLGENVISLSPCIIPYS